jgi:hypothetical protein
MKKSGLLIILILNLALLGFAGYSLYAYLTVKRAETVEGNLPARISIDSEPQGAKIFINGYYKGFTPGHVQIDSVDETVKYKITIVKQGYDKWERDVTLRQGDFKEYHAALEIS